MTINEVYYEQLVSGDNYNNFRIGMRASVKPGEDHRIVLEGLRENVSVELGLIRLEQETKWREQQESKSLLRLQQQYEETSLKLQKLREWSDNNRAFVIAFEVATGLKVDDPPVPF